MWLTEVLKTKRYINILKENFFKNESGYDQVIQAKQCTSISSISLTRKRYV